MSFCVRCLAAVLLSCTFALSGLGPGIVSAANPAQSDTGDERPPVEIPQIDLEQVAEGFAAPLFLASPPDGSGRLFVVDQVGLVHVVTSDGQLLEEPFLDLSGSMVELRSDFDERGLLGFAFHPNYDTNGRVFVTYSAPLRPEAPDNWNYTRRVSEFIVSDESTNQADHSSERVLLEVDWPSRKHNGGGLAFGPQGYLYIGLGDSGGAHGVGLEVEFDAFEMDERADFWDRFAQDIDSLYGSILRIDVDNGYPGYAVPRTNPFVNRDGRDEIYAWGFRNPYRLSFDYAGGPYMFVSATAETLWESIHLVDHSGNYGWAIKEATHCLDRQNPYNPPEVCPSVGPNGYPIADPIIEYPNMSIESDEAQVEGEGLGSAVTGGYLYRGTAIPELYGKFVFTDWSSDFMQPSGQVFMATPSAVWGDLWSIDELLQLDARALSLGQDADGELYVLTNQEIGPTGSTGVVYKIVPSEDE